MLNKLNSNYNLVQKRLVFKEQYSWAARFLDLVNLIKPKFLVELDIEGVFCFSWLLSNSNVLTHQNLGDFTNFDVWCFKTIFHFLLINFHHNVEQRENLHIRNAVKLWDCLFVTAKFFQGFLNLKSFWLSTSIAW